jgi:opine dehydrogenase
VEQIRQAGGITITGAVDGFAPVAVLTTNVQEAVHGADVVAVTVPTPALPHYAAALAETTTEGHLVWLNPGHSGGGVYLGAEFRRRRGERGH